MSKSLIQRTYDRAAGVLLHITSLPGSAFTGDLGPAARRFADFLQESHQKYWQLLPLQPTSNDQGYSPYSSHSSVAGNPLLISLEPLVESELLDRSDIPAENAFAKADFQSAEATKERLLEKAYYRWIASAGTEQLASFNSFCEKEAYWLTDYATYLALKKANQHKPWFEWPAEMREYRRLDFEKLRQLYSEEISRAKWVQMVFHDQWMSLRKYCDERNIQLLGDIPFYVGHDSADVWSHPDIFAIDENGALTGVAGVPPDLFNEDGQLWGMPLFNWDTLKQRKYDWWIQRLRKNLEYFTIVRLDHFRAFASYWSVPSMAKSAKNGRWVKGPGADFFHVVEETFGKLPFIAEDLGEIDNDVYLLRDRFALPGMNVLHFAFGEDMPASPYLPHNHIVNSVTYTGTHDNNTTKGWFSDLNIAELHHLAEYVDSGVSVENVCEHLCRTAYRSVSRLVIIPMQDLLELDGGSRMNMPASGGDNWTWRVTGEQLTPGVVEKLQKWCFYYDRR